MLAIDAETRLSSASPAERYGLVLEEEPLADPRVLADVDSGAMVDSESRLLDAVGVGFAFALLSGFTMAATRLARWLLA